VINSSIGFISRRLAAIISVTDERTDDR